MFRLKIYKLKDIVVIFFLDIYRKINNKKEVIFYNIV